MSKFDLILLFIFALIVCICGADFYLILHGMMQFDPGFWTFVTAVCAGEIVTFSLSKIAKINGGLFGRRVKGKHEIAEETEDNDEKQTD